MITQICTCHCENVLSSNIRRYIFPYNDEFLGILCMNCNQEWLTEDSDAIGINDKENILIFGPHKLHKYASTSVKEQLDFSPRSRTKIESLSLPKRGDHFAYKTPYIFWHHGIVNDVDKENNRIEVKMLSKTVFFLPRKT